MAQPLVGEARGGEELQAFDLAEMCSLTEGEEVEKFRDIVPPASRSRGGTHISNLLPADSDPSGAIEEGEQVVAHLTLGSWLSSRKLARMEALSF